MSWAIDDVPVVSARAGSARPHTAQTTRLGKKRIPGIVVRGGIAMQARPLPRSAARPARDQRRRRQRRGGAAQPGTGQPEGTRRRAPPPPSPSAPHQPPLPEKPTPPPPPPLPNA